MHGRVGLESSLVPGSSLVPTQLPAPNHVDLPLARGFEFVENSETNQQATWESEEALRGMHFSTVPPDVQHLSTASSSGGSGPQPAEQRRPRKKEESGSCDACKLSFSRRSDERRHKNTKHNKEVHACPQCHIVCSRRDALRRHMRDQHQSNNSLTQLSRPASLFLSSL
ncbi:hypothetical protein DFH94DRAFT_707730 [Russula ochroleuca]|uniref:C2H2-type domain-containing protein n=1 Tax=Russula ochroleuca TaxID=152965 RepID=A0A9P5TD51_9AGAM|nr:hypothetical protein DFH94DRAFT_707730 [Russula ochroleuca]